ncbi:hypothetical protein ACHAWF_005452 [Thalassiosira exigua]
MSKSEPYGPGLSTGATMPPSDTPKSALSLQLEEFDRGNRQSTCQTSSNVNAYPREAFPVSSKCHSLRKISKLISDERWIEMDELLRAPAEQAANLSGVGVARSPPRWHKHHAVKDSLELASSLNSLSLDMNTALNGMEVVHFACRFNPPRTIIRHLASLYPEGVTHPDRLGRLPLHYAAKWGASYRLIVYLVQKDPSAATVKDKLGCTPLHLLCKCYRPIDQKRTTGVSPEDNMVEATKALVRAARDTVNIEDNDGTTAVEYAIASDAPYAAVRFIQKASESDWKERKKSCVPGCTHQQIEQNLIRGQRQTQQTQERSRALLRNDASTGPPLSKRAKPRSKYAMTA